MISTAQEALTLLEEHGLMTVVPVGRLPSLVAEITGGPIRGSWWGHPAGKQIFRILTELEAHDDVLLTRLVNGKQTLVHRALFAPLVRAATDEAWRARTLADLSASAHALSALVEERGTLRLDEAPGRLRTARKEIEAALLACVRQEHTESGHHECVLESWSSFARRAQVKVPARLSFESALQRLSAAAPCADLPFTRSRVPKRGRRV